MRTPQQEANQKREVIPRWGVEPTHLKKKLVKLDHFSPGRDENKKHLKPPPRDLVISSMVLQIVSRNTNPSTGTRDGPPSLFIENCSGGRQILWIS